MDPGQAHGPGVRAPPRPPPAPGWSLSSADPLTEPPPLCARVEWQRRVPPLRLCTKQAGAAQDAASTAHLEGVGKGAEGYCARGSTPPPEPTVVPTRSGRGQTAPLLLEGWVAPVRRLQTPVHPNQRPPPLFFGGGVPQQCVRWLKSRVYEGFGEGDYGEKVVWRCGTGGSSGGILSAPVLQ